MKTFEQVLAVAATRTGSVNLLFERAMFSLMDDLDRIVAVLRGAGIPFEVVGGVAVNAHVTAVRPSRSFVTRDVHLLIDRRDLEAITEAATAAGYHSRRILGGFMLIRDGQEPEEAVHLLFAGEKPRSTHPLPNPSVAPEQKALPQFGLTIPVAGIRDLLIMKLNAFRPKDETHIETLDRCGLITPEIEAALPDVLLQRLIQTRGRYQSEDEY